MDVPKTRSLDLDMTFGFLPGLVQFIATKSHDFLFNRPESPAMMQLSGTRLRTFIATMVRGEMNASELYRTTSVAMQNFIAGGIFSALENWHLSNSAVPVETIIADLDFAVSRLFTSLGSLHVPEQSNSLT